MAKILNIRERVHQPFRDALCRTAGLSRGNLNQTTDLFIAQGRDEGFTNLKTSAVLPNDASMIILAARVMQWFRRPVPRDMADATNVTLNGDYGMIDGTVPFAWPNAVGGVAEGNAPGLHNDVYRLHWQCAEGLFWTIGAGEKDSLRSMPTMYFPAGGGLHGKIGARTGIIWWFDRQGQYVHFHAPLIHYNNGCPTHTAILRLARAITITPRQLIKAQVTAVRYPDGGNATLFGTTTANGRDMLNPIDNLNAVDACGKVVSLILDGLLSRDVQ
ncbi:MAG: hypothetical protein WC683_02485 [bacterium]